MTLRVTPDIAIHEDELSERFVRAPGPGGQHVNKVATAVQLSFDVRRSPSLPAAVRARLQRLAGSRLDSDGVLIIPAHRHRTRERNRADARKRLVELIAKASQVPKPRRPTKPSRATKARRVDDRLGAHAGTGHCVARASRPARPSRFPRLVRALRQ